jgi:hypothetical protein
MKLQVSKLSSFFSLKMWKMCTFWKNLLEWSLKCLFEQNMRKITMVDKRENLQDIIVEMY